MTIRTKLAAIAIAVSVAASSHADIVVNHSDRGTFVSPSSFLFTGAFRSFPGPGQGDLYQIRAINSGIATIPPSVGPPIEDSRNFHSFDLSGASGTASGATLRLFVDAGGYDSSAPTETVGLFDVSATPDVLADPNSLPGGELVYADLGSGTSYGSFLVSSADDSNYIDIPLDAALADINAAVGVGAFSVGGALLTIDGTYNAGFISERVFKGDSGTPFELPAQLVLTGSIVPEPTTVCLLVAALSWTAGRRSRGA